MLIFSYTFYHTLNKITIRLKYIFFLIFVLFFSNAIAQFDQDNDNRSRKNFRPSFDDGEISGYVFDKQNKTPLEAVSIQLIKSRDSSLVAGTETDSKGYFKLTNVMQGRYKLLINLTGYNKTIYPVDMTNPEKKIIKTDTVYLNSGAETEEIEVESERPFMELKGEKKIFNVGDNMNVKGGTAIDILKNIPSVTVDIDNNISLRGGSNIKYFINGRPVTGNISRILEQLPADQLNSVEVITNPSAKYEAEGSTAVINLVLKQYSDNGVSGQLDLSSGSKDKYGSGLNINYKTDKYKLLGAYDYRLRNMTFTANIDRNNYFSLSDALTNQSTDGKMRMNGNNFRSEFEYYPSKSDILNLNFRMEKGNRKRGDSDNLLTYNSEDNLQEDSKTVTEDEEDEGAYTLGLNYNKIFKSKKQNLTAESSYSWDSESNNENKVTEYSYPAGQQSFYSKSDGSEKNYLFNIQSDYGYNFSKESGLEAGIKFNIRDTKTDNFYYNLNNTSNVYELDSSFTDDFDFLEKITAGYGIYKNEIGKFSYSLGVRGEYWNYNLDQTFFNVTTSKEIFDIFPSVSLSQKLGLTQEIGFNYSRKVRRPNYRELSPVTRIFSPVMYMKGNPDLNPEYINSFELNFAKFFNSYSIIPSVFYKIKNDAITRTSRLIDSNIVLNTSINANNEVSYGTEILLNGMFGKALSINASFSYFNQEISSDTLGTNSVNTFSGRLFANFSLPYDAGLQVTYFYSGKTATPQGTADPVSSFDVGLKKDFLEKKISLNLRVSDLFKNSKFSGSSATDLYSQTFYRARESQIFTLSLTYKFGSENKSRENKRKKNSDDRENGPDMDF